MTLATEDVRIAAFAASVRSHLDDLPTDDVDDLVDGLEADLAEQAAESEDYELPDAAAYAEELRSAAGLPERAAAPRTRRSFDQWARAEWESASASVRSNRASAAVLGFLVALRPLWWVGRGWAMYAFVAAFTGAGGPIFGFPGSNVGGWLLLGAVVVLSVQWGRGRWAPTRWLRYTRTIVSVFAGVALPFLVLGGLANLQATISQSQQMYDYVDTSQPGLVVDGERVRNIFAYDDQGDPIDGVQLFDQDGRPLTTVGDQAGREDWRWDEYFYGGYGSGPIPVPYAETGRSPLWNVFPLREATVDGQGEVDPSGALVPQHPFVRVPAVVVGSPEKATDAATPAASDPAASDPAATDPAATDLASTESAVEPAP